MRTVRTVGLFDLWFDHLSLGLISSHWVNWKNTSVMAWERLYKGSNGWAITNNQAYSMIDWLIDGWKIFLQAQSTISADPRASLAYVTSHDIIQVLQHWKFQSMGMFDFFFLFFCRLSVITLEHTPMSVWTHQANLFTPTGLAVEEMSLPQHTRPRCSHYWKGRSLLVDHHLTQHAPLFPLHFIFLNFLISCSKMIFMSCI